MAKAKYRYQLVNTRTMDVAVFGAGTPGSDWTPVEADNLQALFRKIQKWSGLPIRKALAEMEHDGRFAGHQIRRQQVIYHPRPFSAADLATIKDARAEVGEDIEGGPGFLAVPLERSREMFRKLIKAADEPIPEKDRCPGCPVCTGKRGKKWARSSSR